MTQEELNWWNAQATPRCKRGEIWCCRHGDCKNATGCCEHNERVPYAKGSETSKAAADSIRRCRGEMERQVYRAFVLAGKAGLTTDEAEVKTGMRHQSCSARVNALAERGLLVLTDKKRPTRSKRMAGVYVAAELL